MKKRYEMPQMEVIEVESEEIMLVGNNSQNNPGITPAAKNGSPSFFNEGSIILGGDE